MEFDNELDFIFAKEPSELLMNVRSHLKKENLEPVSMNVIREHNNFCAIVIGKQKKEEFIG